MIRVGLQIPDVGFPGVEDHELFERIADVARTAEGSGFDSVWVMDHLYQITGRPQDPMPEAYVLLAGLAARTVRVNIGALVTGVTYRNPALLAKMTTTLDLVSAGRAMLGIGAAWNEYEHTGYGYEFPSPRERLDRLDEAVQICRLMFTHEAPSFEGRHYRIREAINRPRPVRPGGPPILVGGSGERRTLRIVAAHADACNVFGDGAAIRRKLDALDAHCADLGRDPKEITRTHLRTVVIAPTLEEAARKGAALRDAWRLDEQRYAAMVVEGDPDTVAERVQALVDAGLDGLIVNLADAWNLETVALAGETLRRVLP